MRGVLTAVDLGGGSEAVRVLAGRWVCRSSPCTCWLSATWARRRELRRGLGARSGTPLRGGQRGPGPAGPQEAGRLAPEGARIVLPHGNPTQKVAAEVRQHALAVLVSEGSTPLEACPEAALCEALAYDGPLVVARGAEIEGLLDLSHEHGLGLLEPGSKARSSRWTRLGRSVVGLLYKADLPLLIVPESARL